MFVKLRFINDFTLEHSMNEIREYCRYDAISIRFIIYRLVILQIKLEIQLLLVTYWA